jgi:4-hydroxy-2-oxoheptanedioate aldolase
MQTNQTKARIRAGQPTFGGFVQLPSPNVVEVLGWVGLDFAVIDCEHGTMDLETVENMVRAAELSGITPITRIPQRSTASAMLRFLDRGVQGLQLPNVASADELREAVQAARYYPEGKRGMGGSRPSEFGLRRPRTEYFPQANRELMLVAMIESVEGINALPEMLKIDGIDVYYVGAGDLSQDMGHPGMADHPEVKAMADKGVEIIKAAGKVAGFNSNAGMVAEYVQKGVLYHCAGDAAFLIAGAQQYLRAGKGA